MVSPFACAPYIKTIGRGARGARGLSEDAAYTLYRAILNGHVSDLELGAVLLAYRIKGEDALEIAGMLRAAHEHVACVHAPRERIGVSLASYNGARKVPNLVPLLAMALARRGVPVVVHGVRSAPARVSTAEVFAALGITPCESMLQAQTHINEAGLAFVPIDVISPALAGQIVLMAPLGVRNSAHTLAKLIEPFTTPSLRLVNYTHEAYFDMLATYFSQAQHAPGPGVLVARGTEGEAVADTALARAATWFHDGQSRGVLTASEGPRTVSAAGSDTSAEATARYIRDVLDGECEMPAAIGAQIDLIESIVTTATAPVHTQ